MTTRTARTPGTWPDYTQRTQRAGEQQAYSMMTEWRVHGTLFDVQRGEFAACDFRMRTTRARSARWAPAVHVLHEQIRRGTKKRKVMYRMNSHALSAANKRVGLVGHTCEHAWHAGCMRPGCATPRLKIQARKGTRCLTLPSAYTAH